MFHGFQGAILFFAKLETDLALPIPQNWIEHDTYSKKGDLLFI